MDAWLFDETAHAGTEHLDPAYVEAYDRKAGIDYAAEVDLLAGLGLDKGATLVDLGCGTGGLVAAASPRCRRVVGVDVSRPMLDLAARRTEGLANVELVRAGFLSYEHAGDRPAVVYSRNALHHLPDFWKAVALRRVLSLLAPGGAFVLRDLVFSFEPADSESVIAAWLSAAPEDPADGWTAAELKIHLRQEFSTFTWLLEPMVELAGFEIVEAEYSESRVFARYVLSSRP